MIPALTDVLQPSVHAKASCGCSASHTPRCSVPLCVEMPLWPAMSMCWWNSTSCDVVNRGTLRPLPRDNIPREAIYAF
jgi:hypothetical protein